MPDTTLVLGNFQFGELEIPEKIQTGGEQRLAVHDLVGGTRIVDSMGRVDDDLEWSGYFLGSDAINRAKYLDGLRVAGTALPLTWSEYNYLVVVKKFKADFRRAYEIPYSISCQVVADNSWPVTTPGLTPVDDSIDIDLDACNTLAPGIGDSLLTGYMGTLTVAIDAVPTFNNAPQSVVNSVLAPLGNAQSRVQALLASTGAATTNVPGFGGIVAGISPLSSAATLNAQVSSSEQLFSLYQMRNLLGRMGSNLSALGSSSLNVAVVGGNLFQIASQQYGDAMAWTGIAKANGMTNPFLQGPNVLSIPPQADVEDGVLAS